MIWLIATAALMIFVGFAILLLGGKIVSRRPVLITSKTMFAFMFLACIPIFVAFFLRVVHPDFDFSTQWMHLLMAPMYALFLIFIRKAFGDVILFNVDEDLVYDSIQKTLDEVNIPYEEKRGRILIPSLNSDVRLACHAPFKNANIFFNMKEAAAEKKTILNSFEKCLDRNPISGLPWIGILYIILAFFLFATAVGMLVSIF